MTFRIMPYEGWDIGEIIVDGVSVAPASSYTFTNVTENHTIRVTAVQIPEDAAPLSAESVRKLIDYLVNGKDLDGNYDFDRNGIVDGRDLIILQQAMRV